MGRWGTFQEITGGHSKRKRFLSILLIAQRVWALGQLRAIETLCSIGRVVIIIMTTTKIKGFFKNTITLYYSIYYENPHHFVGFLDTSFIIKTIFTE